MVLVRVAKLTNYFLNKTLNKGDNIYFGNQGCNFKF